MMKVMEATERPASVLLIGVNKVSSTASGMCRIAGRSHAKAEATSKR